MIACVLDYVLTIVLFGVCGYCFLCCFGWSSVRRFVWLCVYVCRFLLKCFPLFGYYFGLLCWVFSLLWLIGVLVYTRFYWCLPVEFTLDFAYFGALTL